MGGMDADTRRDDPNLREPKFLIDTGRIFTISIKPSSYWYVSESYSLRPHPYNYVRHTGAKEIKKNKK